jgi:LPS sulfotransferase NodH
MLSAYENGLRARQENRQNAFSQLINFETALKFIEDYVLIWDAWMSCKGILTSRYEDLLSSYDDEVDRLLDFLPIQVDKESLQPIIERYRPESSQRESKGLHFNKGKIGRYQTHWNLEELVILQHELGPYIDRMGYA